MNDKELIEYHDQNGVRPYHGVKSIDALKHLSEIPGLPAAIAKDYHGQYERALVGLGTRTVPNMGELLYVKYRGETCVERGKTVKEFTWAGVTIRAVEVRMARFERMNEYFDEHAERGFPKTTYTVLDIEAAGTSTLQQLLDTPGSAERLFCIDGLLKLADKQEWNTVTTFHKPYNGITADQVVDIYQDLVRRMGAGSRGSSEQNVRSYIKTVTAHFTDIVDTKPITETVDKIDNKYLR